MRPTRSLLAFALGLLSGCLDGPTGPKITLDQHAVTVGGAQRTYLVYSEGLDLTKPRPLLLLYHGSGGSAVDMLNTTGLAALGRDAGMVVASLDAIEGYGGRWATNPVDLPVADDVAFTRAVVDDIAATAAIDRTRIYAIGFSRGGDFVYQLACRAGDLVRGVASVAATMLYTSREWCDVPDPSPFPPGVAIAIGSQDPLMPWNGGLTNRMGAPETSEYWAARYGCEAQADPIVDGVAAGFEYIRYQYGCEGTDLRLYRMAGMSHMWPGAFLEKQILEWLVKLPQR